MLNVALLIVGLLVGFVGSRALRRPAVATNVRPGGSSPARAAAPTSVARSATSGLGRRKGLTPPELQRACFSEMVRHVRVGRDGTTEAPAAYVLHLHPDDLAVVDENRRYFTDGLVDALRQAARDNGWALTGAVHVEYVADPSRRAGVPSARATPPHEPPGATAVAPPPAPAASATAPARGVGARTLVLVRSDTSERIPLVADAVTIGRSRDRVVMVDDTRVSRSHARVEARKDGWAIIDDGSANGTTVNGEELPTGRPCPLRSGDVIGIGPVELRVTTGAAPGADAGTRALDDSDRTRISGEVLPPSRWPDA